MKKAIFLLLLICLAASTSPAGDEDILGAGQKEPTEGILEVLDIAYLIIIPMMFAMIALAAAAYVIGHIFGAETRAKANVWAQGMLASVGISALVLIMLSIIVPAWQTGGVPGGTIVTATPGGGEVFVGGMLGELARISEMALTVLTVVFVVLAAATYAIGQVSGAETRARAVVWATGLLSGAIVSAVIYVLLFQVLTPLGATVFRGTAVAPYASVIITVTFFVSFIILITYMVSKVFKIPEWEAYLSIELGNLMSSFLIVLFVTGMFAAGGVFSAVYAQDLSPPRAALEFVSDILNSVLKGVFDTYQIQACTSILSTISRRIGEFVLTQTYKVFPGVDTFVSITNVIAFGLVSVYGSLSAQVALLYLIDATMIHFVLPAGLILRFFPPTRDAGAFLISLAFGLQIIFPTCYLINKMILEDLGITEYETPTAIIQSVCGPFKFAAYGIAFNPATNPLSVLPGFGPVLTILGRFFSEATLNFISMSEFIVWMKRISTLSLLSLFMPALSMLITVAFINAMTKFIVAKV